MSAARYARKPLSATRRKSQNPSWLALPVAGAYLHAILLVAYLICNSLYV